MSATLDVDAILAFAREAPDLWLEMQPHMFPERDISLQSRRRRTESSGKRIRARQRARDGRGARFR